MLRVYVFGIAYIFSVFYCRHVMALQFSIKCVGKMGVWVQYKKNVLPDPGKYDKRGLGVETTLSDPLGAFFLSEFIFFGSGVEFILYRPSPHKS